MFQGVFEQESDAMGGYEEDSQPQDENNDPFLKSIPHLQHNNTINL